MKYAIIENGIVVNIVVAEPEYANTQGWVAVTDGAGIGWTYGNNRFVDNRSTPEPQQSTTKEELLAQLQALQAQIQAL